MPAFDGVHAQEYKVRGVKYVRLWWYTGDGSKRGQQSIGRAAQLTKAQIKAKQLAKQTELAANPAMVVAGQTPTFSQWVAQYKARRIDLKPGTLQLIDDAAALWQECHGDQRLDRITLADVDRWVAWLTQQEGRAQTFDDGETGKQTMLPETVAKHCRTLSAVFGKRQGAMRAGHVAVNPFAGRAPKLRTKIKPPAPVTNDVVHALIDAAPSREWASLIGLTAWTGMRLTEAMAMEWSHIQWKRNRMTIPPAKTEVRECLMVPELAAVLSESFEAADHGARLICGHMSQNNLQRTIKAICSKAGVPHWDEPFRALRRWREVSWFELYPAPTVTAWLGHSPTVSAKHYASVPEAHYQDGAMQRLMQSVRKLDAMGLQRVQELVESLQNGATLAQHPQKQQNPAEAGLS